MNTVAVVFYPGGKPYVYMNDDPTIKAGDRVVVQPRGELKVVYVTEVHDKPKLSGGYQYDWIVQKIDMTNYERLVIETHEGVHCGNRL